MEKRIFLKELTPAEAGETRTHESYIRMPNNFDYEEFFQDRGSMTGSVLQINFMVALQGDPGRMKPLKFVYYINNTNQEKRIPSLKGLFGDFSITSGYTVELRSISSNGTTHFELYFYKPSEVKLLSSSPILYYIIEREGDKTSRQEQNNSIAFQQIFYGAPGTGKSHAIKVQTEEAEREKRVVRMTFHPDSDYSTFVGAYKPTTTEETLMTVIGTKATPVENPDGSIRKENRIIYEFVPQAFLQAYVAAWVEMVKAANEGRETKNEYLVIEEINRGNCAQIFGDFFQLLDRNDDGFSDYCISPDQDIRNYLNKEFSQLLTTGEIENCTLAYAVDVLSGEKMMLPNNLYIWATMNTSDQSLFPIDSAFKRRWDWQYVPIEEGTENDVPLKWNIMVKGKRFDWWQFLQAINNKVGDVTSSEDKKLGYFFCKADSDGIISAAKFVGKVLFYLWNDVFKDFGEEDNVFTTEDGKLITFDKFYDDVDLEEKVNTDLVLQFMKNLKLQPIDNDRQEVENSEDYTDQTEA